MAYRQSPAVHRDYKCQCGKPVFLRNTQCVTRGSQLRDTNGRQLAKMMRERRPGLKVMFITDYAPQAALKASSWAREWTC